MNKQPLVSVNMAAYNAGPYIGEAIQSVIGQTYQNWELIIVNDCSTDNTLEEINKFNDPRIRVFHNEQNEGIVYTRNRALHYSQGKYVSVLDADDVYLSAKLQTQVDFLEQRPDYAMVGSAFRFLYQETNTLSKVICWYAKAEYFPAILLFNNFFVHSSTMFRTHLAKDILYKPLVKGCAPGEEYQLFVEFTRTYKIYNINNELMYYRQHPVSISKVREDKINEYIDIIVLNQLKRVGISPSADELKLHKSIRFAFDHLTTKEIRSIKKWLHFLLKKNKEYKVYDRYFEEYLAIKWYELAKLNAEQGITMLVDFFSSSLAYHPAISKEEKIYLLKRCFYETKKKITS